MSQITVSMFDFLNKAGTYFLIVETYTRIRKAIESGLDTGERGKPGRKETAVAGSEQEWTVDVFCQREVSATQRTHQSRPHRCQ